MADEWAATDVNDKPGLTAVSSSDGITILRLWANPSTHRLLVDASGSSTSIVLLTATGTVDDSNTTFTFTSTPQIVVVNGMSYRNGHGVTIVTTTATLDSPAGTGGDVYGIK